jgi:ABC-type multidrug transport system fused ATPase/permease subunit
MSDHYTAIRHISKHPGLFAGVLSAGFINSCATFLLPVSIGEFFVLQFHSGNTKGKLLAWAGLEASNLSEFATLFAGLLLVKMFSGYLASMGAFRLGETFVQTIREEVFAAQMRWEAAALSNGAYSKYLLRYSNDMKALQNYFSKGILEAARSLLFIATGMLLTAQLHAPLTLALTGLLAASAVAVYGLAWWQKPLIAKSRSRRNTLLAFVTKSFADFPALKRRAAEADTVSRFNRRSTNLYRANMRSNRFDALQQHIIPLLIFSMIGALLWQMALPGTRISAGDGWMMILMILMMQGAFRRMLKVPGFLNKGKLSLQKVREVMERAAPQPAAATNTSFTVT